MLNLYQTYKKERPRLTNNIILSVVTLIGCVVAMVLASPTQAPLEALTVGTGYVGLGLLALTLLIGPINMLKVRKNPVNLNFRRDAGIWAGIVSLAHVVLAFGLEINWGGTLLGYFLYKDGSPKLNLFGISNYIGLAATLVLILLLVLSNNHFLKSLKGKKWKNLQRFNYLLFALVLGHTFTQQVNNVRGLWMIAGALLVTVGVMAGQAIGFRIYRKREAERKVAPTAKAVPARAVVASKAPVPATGFTKLKVGSAVSLVAMLGIGAGLEGLSLLNQPVTAETGSLASDETASSNTSSAATASAPAASETAASTTAAATAATTSAATATATTAATTSVATTAAATTAASTTAATTTATTTTAATATAATTTAATTTAATTTKATTTASATTVSSSSKSSGSTHTGGS